MPVTPFHVPFKNTEYKPLGIENLMQPLSDMQTKYDATNLALEDATYNIARLSQDDTRGKELVKELQGKTDYIAEELARTGNYRQAAIQLKKLNKSFAADAETKAVVGNYEAYKKAYDEQEKRLKEKIISQKDLETWDYKIKNTFNGTNYDPGTQKYTSINTRPPEENRETELQDLSLKITGMLANNQIDEIRALATQNNFSEANLKNTITYRDHAQTQIEVANFLKTQPRFQEYLLDKADREFFYNNHRTETLAANNPNLDADQFKDAVYEGSLKKMQNQLDFAKKQPNNEDAVKKLQNNLNELQKSYQEAQANGTYSEFALDLYKQDQLGYLDRLAYTATDLVDFRSSKLDLSITKNTEAEKNAQDASVKKMAEIGVIPTTISAGELSNLPATGVIANTGTGDPLNSAKIKLQEDFETVTANDKSFELKTLDENFGATASNIYKSSIGLQNIFKNYSTTITKDKNEILNLNNQIAKAKDPAVIKELKAKKETLSKEIISNQVSLVSTQNMLNGVIQKSGDLLFSSLGNIQNNFVPIPDEVLKQTGNQLIVDIKNPTTYTDITFDDQTKKEYDKILEKNGYNPKTFEATSTANPLGLLNSLSSVYFKELEEIKSSTKKSSVTPEDVTFSRNKDKDYATIVLGQILKQYETNLKIDNPSVVNPLEVTMSDELGKFSGGVSTSFAKEILDNTTGASAMTRANITNSSTLANTSGDTDYTIAAYDTERPHLVGKDPDGNWIVRYNIKEEYASNKQNTNGAVANAIKTGWGVNKEEAPKGSSIVDQTEVANWRKANPDNLYLNTRGTNLDLSTNTSDVYANIVENGIKLATKEGQEAVIAATENFAPIWMISDSKRRELYWGAAQTINDGISNNEYKNFVEGPAIWNNLGNGTSEGFAIQYEVKDQKLTANVSKLTKNENGEIIKTEFVTTKEVDKVNSNLPTALLMLNMTYGTGRPEDIPMARNGYENINFVPAFYMKDGDNVTNSNRVLPVGTVIR
jgi:hypothetical protein